VRASGGRADPIGRDAGRRLSPVDGCQDGDGFGGADFRFLAANVVREDTGRTIFPAYAIKRYRGVRIGFIGLPSRRRRRSSPRRAWRACGSSTRRPRSTTPLPEIRRRGAETIVVLLHQGGNHTGFGINDCDGVAEPIRSPTRSSSRRGPRAARSSRS
jgi:5'-nucleotidase